MPLFIAKTKLIILQNVSEINSKNLKTKRLAIIILIAKLLTLIINIYYSPIINK